MERFSRTPMPAQPYDKMLSGILCFKTFAECEATLVRLENLRRDYLSRGDLEGVKQCRAVALLGRKRAEAISRNNKVMPRKRDQKREVANWFRIWLETPDIFQEWLSLRKDSEEFHALQELERIVLEENK